MGAAGRMSPIERVDNTEENKRYFRPSKGGRGRLARIDKFNQWGKFFLSTSIAAASEAASAASPPSSAESSASICNVAALRVFPIHGTCSRLRGLVLGRRRRRRRWQQKEIGCSLSSSSFFWAIIAGSCSTDEGQKKKTSCCRRSNSLADAIRERGKISLDWTTHLEQPPEPITLYGDCT